MTFRSRRSRAKGCSMPRRGRYRRAAGGQPDDRHGGRLFPARRPAPARASRRSSTPRSASGFGGAPRGARSRCVRGFAVIAVPHPLVLETSFDPPLSPDRIGMFSELPMGSASKLVIPTDGPPPLLSVQSAQLPFWCWTGAGADGAVRPCLTSFAGSRPAQDALGTGAADPRRWRERIAQLVPEVQLAGESVLQAWAGTTSPAARTRASTGRRCPGWTGSPARSERCSSPGSTRRVRTITRR